MFQAKVCGEEMWLATNVPGRGGEDEYARIRSPLKDDAASAWITNETMTSPVWESGPLTSVSRTNSTSPLPVMLPLSVSRPLNELGAPMRDRPPASVMFCVTVVDVPAHLPAAQLERAVVGRRVDEQHTQVVDGNGLAHGLKQR